MGGAKSATCDLRPPPWNGCGKRRVGSCGNMGGARTTAFPPPLWGRDRVGGSRQPLLEGLPPPLTPPHKGEGNMVGARATTFPPPLWGRDRVGGSRQLLRAGFPPPLAPPHQGEGNPGGVH